MTAAGSSSAFPKRRERDARKGADYLIQGAAGGQPFHGRFHRGSLTKMVRNAIQHLGQEQDIEIDVGDYKPKGHPWRVMAAIAFVVL